MTDIIPFGIGKVQRMPYSLWEGIRQVSSESDLVSFVQANKCSLGKLVVNRLSEGKAKALFDDSFIGKRQEAFYLAETIKSAVLRGGGSYIIDWALWLSDGFSLTSIGQPPQNEVSIGGSVVNVSHVIELDKSLMSRLERATTILHNALAGGKRKILSRADYVLEQDSNGFITPCLVDVGESNLSFALTDALFNSCTRSMQHQSGLLDAYVDLVLSSYGENPHSAVIIAENVKMTTDMPYEFAALSNAMGNKIGSGKVSVTSLETLTAEELLKNDLVLRCFRSQDASGRYMKLAAGKNQCPFVAESLEFIPIYSSKTRIREVIGQNRRALDSLVKVPASEIFWLQDIRPEDLATNIFGAFSGDIVIKPADKPFGASSAAHFYNTANAYHLQQAGHSLAKIYRAGVKSVVVEEAVGTAFADGKKTELRVFALDKN